MTEHPISTASEPGNDWVGKFISDFGRPPRLLHIGNIANNAYLNAKILRKAGVECDVLCYNYYHIMGCPEWEEADFESNVDEFYPNWDKVNLHGYRRPRWFVQGPLWACFEYLSSPRTDSDWKTLLHLKIFVKKDTLSGTVRRVWRATVDRKYGIVQKLRRFRVARFVWHAGIRQVVMAVRNRRPAVHPANPLNSTNPVPEPPENDPFDARAGILVDQFARLFEAREDRLTRDDLHSFRSTREHWIRLFADYDAVIGYATDGHWAMVADKKPYFAYEHGTIRQIPFEATTQGRLCALTYRLADTVLITNCDNITAAQKLGLTNYRFIPHPVNEDIPVDKRAEDLRKNMRERLDADFVVFHPSRQHWESCRHPSWEKGNDIFIRGFAQFVREVNPRAGAVCVEWGKMVNKSKELMDHLGISRRVLWIPPQPNAGMMRYIAASDLLADQFYLGAFGSTMPKALLHGCPAMLHLDEDRHRWCFPEMPPVVNARTPEEVFAGLKRLYKEPNYRADLIRRGQEWYAKYHSNRIIANTFISVLGNVLGRQSGSAGAK